MLEPIPQPRPGKPYPLGATFDGSGVNFAIYSQHAEEVELVLFRDTGSSEPYATVSLPERTGPVWHGYLPDLGPGLLYGYRVHGPYQPEKGHRFNSNKVLLDPYARKIGRPMQMHDSIFGYKRDAPDGDASFNPRDSAAYAPLGMVCENGYDWGDDAPPGIPWEQTVIYETHVKGLSKLNPAVPEELRGTFKGLAHESVIRHFQRIGVTTVQLLPVHAKAVEAHLNDHGLTNYWGYGTLNYFSPEPTYAADPENAVNEFKAMVHALHREGLEVIIDVVYNHTGEGSRMGPTVSFRGIDNRAYYKENPSNPRYLLDYTGTGNTLDAGNPHVLQLITDSLRYWVQEMHVDGFRFDLASSLARDLYEVNMLSAFFKVVQQDPVLSQVKLIAEPWDVGPGGYQVGGFPWLWTEWNAAYRDTVRRFWRGDTGVLGEFATRVSGSSDLYNNSGRRPFASINFVTAHDGFTLRDLVSYERKHNEANGENNRDGNNANFSTNCGHEGDSWNKDVLACREARVRALLTTLFLSQGVPMLLGGDELWRTQLGNNNAYCQDNALSWYDWSKADPDLLEFVTKVIDFRALHPNFRRHRFLSGQPNDSGLRDVTWWHPKGRMMLPDDWRVAHARTLGMLLRGDVIEDRNPDGSAVLDDSFLVLYNASDSAATFVMPPEQTELQGHWEVALQSTGTVEASTWAPGDAMILPRISVTVLKAVSAPDS
ncbi:MAG: glycogen debranching protein GlgX [Rhodothermales bacterium]|nr:glycogen debranching protein GlgX [Rhodothermales bacterium]MBO6780964.1 glycogen debranching protein GlgX [Rhodothermales bacterium]